MNKEELIKEIKKYRSKRAHNVMGCSEDWYSVAYAMKQTFTLEEIENMTESEVANLIKLADNIQEGLY